MKKIIISISLLFVLLVAGVAVFLLTFDANKQLPVLTREISKVVGNPVRIGRISLVWDNGISFDLRQLEIFEGEIVKGKVPSLKVERVMAKLSLLPLFRGKIQIGSVTIIRPDIRVIRKADGEFQLAGLNPSAAEPAGVRKGAAPLALIVDRLIIEKARLLYYDAGQTPPVRLLFKDADIVLENLSLIQPVDFKVKFSFLSDEQNIKFKGRLRYHIMEGTAELTEFRLESDLSDLKRRYIQESIPGLDPDLIPLRLEGRIDLKLDELTVTQDRIKTIQGNFRLSQGVLFPAGGGLTLEKVNIETHISSGSLEFNPVSAEVAGGTVNGSVTVKSYLAMPETVAEITIRGVRLQELVPTSVRTEPRVEGTLNGQFRLQATGYFDAVSLRTMTGSGQFSLVDAVIRNFNLLREVFQNLSMIPGLTDRLQNRLSEEYLQKLEARDTLIQEVFIPFRIQSGVVHSDNLRITTDTMAMTGRGDLSLQGGIAFQTMLSLDPEISDAFIRSVEELRFLTDSQGRLQIPVQIQGTVNRPIVFPDLAYVGQKLAVQKVQEWIGSFIRKQDSQPTGTQPIDSGTEPGTLAPPQDTRKPLEPAEILGQLLQSFLEPQN